MSVDNGISPQKNSLVVFKHCHGEDQILIIEAFTARTPEDARSESADAVSQQPEASSSGLSLAAAEHAELGTPGVFIVHADGSAATDAGYAR